MAIEAQAEQVVETIAAPDFDEKKRRGLAVWLYSLKQVKVLRHYGTIHYASRKMKYVVLYVDDDKVEETVSKLTKLRFVKKVLRSERPEIATTYGQDSELARLQQQEVGEEGENDAGH